MVTWTRTEMVRGWIPFAYNTLLEMYFEKASLVGVAKERPYVDIAVLQEDSLQSPGSVILPVWNHAKLWRHLGEKSAKI